jgi:hypothetical protein
MTPIKLDKVTPSYPKAKEYQKIKIAGIWMDETKSKSLDSVDSQDDDST